MPEDKADIHQVIALIVTYGRRAHLVEQIIKSLEAIGVTAAIIVDNGSEAENALALKNIAACSSLNVKIVTSASNLGSAAGFSLAFSEALKMEQYQFLWLLDDDNLPARDSLSILIQYWLSLNVQSADKVALLSLRPSRNEFINAAQSGNGFDVLQKRNHFLGFHIGRIAEKITERLFSRKQTKLQLRPVVVPVAPYGGFLLHKSTLNWLELPNPDYVLYMDDFDFSYRFTHGGGKIWLVPESIVTDIEDSYYIVSGRKPLLSHSVIDATNDFRVFYGNRNTMFFYNSFFKPNNTLIYTTNKILFWWYIKLLALLKNKSGRIALLQKAIKDGNLGKMGKTLPL